MYSKASQSPTSPNPHHKKLLPIETLPIEVFRVIVRLVVQKAPRLSCTDQGSFGVLIHLRLVCTRWAQVIEENPEFWQTLSLYSSEELVRLILKRALDWPLDICGTVRSTSVLNLALRESHRWRSVDVQIDSQPNLDLLLSRPAPLLESLAVQISGHGINNHSPILFNEAAPRLQVVRLTGCPLPWSSSTLCGLRELRICSIRGTIRYTTFLDILKRCPELAYPAVSSTNFELPDARSVRVALHRLRSLELKSLNPSVTQTLVSSIEVPILANCHYAARLEGDDRLEEALSPLFQRLKVLVELSRDLPWTLRMAMGGTARWTKSGWDDSLAGEATLEYQGSNPHGALSIVVTSEPSRHAGIFDYFVGRLATLIPNTIPPSLHFIRLQHAPMDSGSNLLICVERHFPHVREIVIEDTSHQARLRALSRLLIPSAENSRLFHHLSSLTLRAAYHDDWVAWLETWRTREGNSTATEPLQLTTLRVKDGMIGPRKVEVLKALVPNLILEDVKIEWPCDGGWDQRTRWGSSE
ncbi:hypothetical protein M407DRAFT_32194 [Tulasnella calospora MUT 4182]|uniref:F-box domain-containing protein n=1 Tax=Tulasnella calospora MUT 4182 TaxID=1051891 RepID=A0A0C3Q575_9AGAM|nr:hypothetical protein M407DRAFT_32194 [Tulasnella calospora MUT 4182]